MKAHGVAVICGECGNSFPDTKTCEDHIGAIHRTTPYVEPFPVMNVNWYWVTSIYSRLTNLNTMPANKSHSHVMNANPLFLISLPYRSIKRSTMVGKHILATNVNMVLTCILNYGSTGLWCMT